MTYDFIVYGTPVAKGRPRFSVVNGFVKTHTTKKTSDYEQSVYNSFCSYFPDCKINYEKGVEIEITIYFPLSNSLSKKKKKEMEDTYMLKRPDIDNIIKSILDGLNRIFDDKYIVSVKATKKWSVVPRSLITLREC